MKAAVISSYGDAQDVFNFVANFAQPLIKPDEVLIKMVASSVNAIECKARRGYGRRVFSKKRGFEFPLVLGNDVCGVVEKVGSNVKSFRPGDDIFSAPAVSGQGSYGEYRVMKASQLVDKPKKLSYLEAATIPYVALTTWSALVDKAKLNAHNCRGKKVLVHGGSGGIGSFAIQLLKAWGAFVATTCSSAKVDRVRELGADLVIDYQKDDFSKQLQNYDVVFDTVGGDYEAKSMKVLNGSGDSHYVTVVFPAMTNIDEKGFLKGGLGSVLELLKKKRMYKKRGVTFNWGVFGPNRQALEEVKTLIEQGKIKPVVDKVYPLEKIADAHDYFESGKVIGKLAISIT